MITDNKTIAESFSKFFLGTVGRLADTMNKAAEFFSGQTRVTSAVGIRRTTSTFMFEEISEQFIFTQLHELKTSKAVGLDQMPSRLMKDSARVNSKPLTFFMNVSISQGCVPQDWKIPGVIPLFKGGKKIEMDNYRPSSILPTASKILERAIHTQFCRFLSMNNLLSASQCGFRKGYSTGHAVIAFWLITFVEAWIKGCWRDQFL